MLNNVVIDPAEFKSALNFEQGLLLHCYCGSFCQKSVLKSPKTSGSDSLLNTPLLELSKNCTLLWDSIYYALFLRQQTDCEVSSVIH